MPRPKKEQPDPRYAKSVLVRVPKAWHRTLRDLAYEQEKPVSDLVREAVKAQYNLPCDCCPPKT